MSGGAPNVNRGVGGLDSSKMPPVSTASYGKVLPVVYGTNRLAGQIIDMPPELWANASQANAGKGGGSGQSGYYQGVRIAIAEGASTNSTGRMWIDKNVFPVINTDIDLNPNNTYTPFEFLAGGRPQSVPADWVTSGVPSLINCTIGGGSIYSVVIAGLGHNAGYAATTVGGQSVPGATICFQDGEQRSIVSMAASGSNDVALLNTPLTTAPAANSPCVVIAPLYNGLSAIRQGVTGSIPSTPPYTVFAAAAAGAQDNAWIADAQQLYATNAINGNPGLLATTITSLVPGGPSISDANYLAGGCPVSGLYGATFTCTMSGDSMSVTAIARGTLVPGQIVMAPNWPRILSQTSGTTGGIGVYAVTAGQGGNIVNGTNSSGADYNATQGAYTFAGATFNATLNAAGTLTVNSISGGAIYVNMRWYSATGVGGYIVSLGTGTGGVGTYLTQGTPFTSAFTGQSCFGGAAGATINKLGYVVSTDIGKYALPYSGTSYVVTKAMTLGSSNAMKNVSFEFNGLLTTSTTPGDVNAATILSDMLTNSQYGMSFPPSAVNVDVGPDGNAQTSLWTYCQAQGLFLSPIFDEQKSALDHIQWILAACNAECVWSQGVWNFFPRGDANVAAAGFTASIVGSTMTVSAVAGTIAIGAPAFVPGSGLGNRVTIVSQSSGVTGGAGVYGISSAFGSGVVGAAATTGYVAFVTTRYVLTEDHILAAPGQDMIKITRKKPSEIFNCCPVEFVDSQTQDADSQYQISIVQDIEEPNIIATGGIRRQQGTLSLKCITKQAIAQFIARTRAQRQVYVRNTYEFALGPQHCLLEPFDLVQISDSIAGLPATVVRILSVDQDADDDLKIIAEDAGIGASTTTQYVTGSAQGGGHITSYAPPPVTIPIIYVPPLAATGRGPNAPLGVLPQPVHLPKPVGGGSTGGGIAPVPELWVGTASAAANWGGAQVHVSYDGLNYQYQGDVGQATVGTVAAGSTYAAGTPLDTTNTLSVDLTPSKGTISPVTAADRDASSSMALVNTGTAAELVAYQGSTLTSGSTFALTNNRRGLYGTPVGSHPAGVQVAVIDSNIMRVQIDTSRVVAGGVVSVKLASYNLAKTQVQSLATAPVYTYPLTAPGATGANVLSMVSLPLKISFDNYNAADWDFPVNSGQLTVASAFANSTAGSRYLDCTGATMMVYRHLVAFDPNKQYRFQAAARLGGSGSSRTVYAGFVAVADDGTTQLDINGSSSNPTVPSMQHGAALTISPHVPPLWKLLKAFYSGTSATGIAAPAASTNPNSPSTAYVNTKYMRPFIAFNFDPNGTSAGMDINYFQIDELPLNTDSPVISNYCSFAANQSNAQSIPNGVKTIMLFNNLEKDTDSGYNGTTGQYAIPAGKGGDYLICAGLIWNANPGPYSEIAIFKNGIEIRSNILATGAALQSLEVNSLMPACVPGDLIDIRAYQPSGASVTLQNQGIRNYFTLNRVLGS